jgi:hypothetical protein
MLVTADFTRQMDQNVIRFLTWQKVLAEEEKQG